MLALTRRDIRQSNTAEQSAIDELIEAHISSAEPDSTGEEHLHYLALQVLHNLQYQHNWHSLQIHTSSPLNTSAPLPRPIISGLPPRPIYVHPDRQIELIKAGIEEKDTPAAKEWVLPTHLREKWSLKQFADVFKAIDRTPPDPDKTVRSNEETRHPRELKRVLLATIDDDSTVVYYIVHDGIVKPRQN